MAPQQFDREKFKDAVHYIVVNTRPDELGLVKLHKVLYFSDMLWFLGRGTALTGAEYRKQQFGPCASFLRRALSELEQAGRIRQSREWYFGYDKHSFASLTDAPMQRLTDAERSLLGDITDFVCRNNTAKSISEFSHTRAWEAASLGQVMPYYTAINILPVEIDDEDLDWAMEEAAKIETERSRGSSLQRRGYTEFREGLRRHRGEVAARG